MRKLKAGLICLILGFLTACTMREGEISGSIITGDTSLSGAVIRIQTTSQYTLSDEDGRFEFTGLKRGSNYVLTAWAPGYYIAGGIPVSTGTSDYTIKLHPIPARDNPDYQWLSAYQDNQDQGSEEDNPCQKCHSDSSGLLPYEEWQQDKHSQTASNPVFLTMYTGTDAAGNPGQYTQAGTSRDYGDYPLKPNPDQPDYGPGYKLDFPKTAGNCSACHLPGAAVNHPYDTDPTAVSSRGSEGISCDFCHKISSTRLDDQTGLPHPNRPGVLSLDLLRPFPGHQVFIGPLDDVAPGEDTYSPHQSQSDFCAACHFGVFWDTVIYNSYGEWLESEYADPQSTHYQTCQGCHIPPSGTDHFARIQAGGLLRNPETIASHKYLGIEDADFIRQSADLSVTAVRSSDSLDVTATIENNRTGHHLPTDSPLRQLILVVSALDKDGLPLAQLEGPSLPNWTGVGAPAEGYYGGLPGTAYAKILEEIWNQHSPSAAYWNQTRIISDNRIPALTSAVSNYSFRANGSSPIYIDVKLIYRRAFIELRDLKNWDIEDLIISEEHLIVQ